MSELTAPDTARDPETNLAKRLFSALRTLSSTREPHPCGGFTTDDMQHVMGTAFIPSSELESAIANLQVAGKIRFSGLDDNDAIGHCYEIYE